MIDQAMYEIGRKVAETTTQASCEAGAYEGVSRAHHESAL